MELRLLLRIVTLSAATALMLICGTSEEGSGAAEALPALETAPAPLLTPPVSPVDLVRGVDLPEHPWLSGHRGADLAVATGALVRSPADGVVSYAGTIAGRGIVSVLVEGTGLRTTLEPVDATVDVGDPVRQGDLVGRVQSVATVPGIGHCAPSACLHWGLLEGDDYRDPFDWTTGWGPIRLKAAG